MDAGQISEPSFSSLPKKKQKETALDTGRFLSRLQLQTTCLKCCAIVWKEIRTLKRNHSICCLKSLQKFPDAHLKPSGSRTYTVQANPKRIKFTTLFRQQSVPLCLLLSEQSCYGHGLGRQEHV